MRRPFTSSSIPNSSITRVAKQDSITKHYEFVKAIGYGAFGTVREAVRINQHETAGESDAPHYAVKSINKNKLKKHLAALQKELSILHMLDHPNIVKLYEIYEDEMYIHLVTELCTGGDILENWSARKISTETDFARIIHKILLAVNHLHSMHICHRDLKPENVLFLNGNDDSDVKLIDFGFSSKFMGNDMDSFVGSPRYLAPEIIKGYYGKECDIWSLGVMMYFLLAGKFPFPGNSMGDQFKKILKGEYSMDDPSWLLISDEAKNLVSRMLVLDPELRITASEALRHQWFQSINIKSNPIDAKIFQSIKRYKDKGKLWNVAMKVLVRNLSQDQIDDLKAAFHEIDRMKTGFVTADDIEACMNKNGYQLAKEEFNSLLANIELLGKGKLNYTQFLIAAIDRKKVTNEEHLWMTFRYFDVDSNGKICLEDLKSAIEKAGCYVSETEYGELMNEFELQYDDTINYSYFVDIMNCKT